MPSSSSSEIVVDFAAGCLGGAAGVLAGHPLDTVKVRVQTQNLASAHYLGSYACFKEILVKEGLRGFYKGLSSPLAGLTFINAIIFGVQGNVVKRFGDQTSLFTHFVAGACAGSAQAIIASPMELLKLRVQINGAATSVPSSPLTPYSCLQEIIKNREHKTLLRGMIATQLRDTPALGVYFVSYEFLARRLSHDGSKEALTSMQLLFAGGASGMISWLFNYPIDVIKTRFQADNISESYRNVVDRAYKEGGLRAFFAGFTPTILRAFPTNAATFFTVEWTYRILIDGRLLRSGFLNDALAAKEAQPEYNISLKTKTGACREKSCAAERSGWSVFQPTLTKVWNAKTFLLPEAGTTLMEPYFIHS